MIGVPEKISVKTMLVKIKNIVAILDFISCV